MVTTIENEKMYKIKLVSYLFHPKILVGLLLVDMSGLLGFINKYIFSDTTYLKFLVVACAVDLVTGITKVWVTQGVKAITSKGLRDTISKMIQYGGFLIITHVLTHFEINGKANENFMWLTKVAYEFLILIEIKSVYENLIRINPKLDFIEGVIQKFINVLKTKKDENSN